MPDTIAQDLFNLASQIEISKLWDPAAKQPTWYWSILLGAIIGTITASILGHTNKAILFPVFLFNYFFKKSAFVGDWHVYHWSYLHGKPELIKSFAKIRRGLIHTYTVSLKQDVESKLSYKGVVGIEKDQLIVSFKSRNHQENLVVRLRHPLGTTSDKIMAIWLGYDHEGDVASGGLLLSKKELEIDDAKSKISGGIEKAPNATLMCVKRN